MAKPRHSCESYRVRAHDADGWSESRTFSSAREAKKFAVAFMRGLRAGGSVTVDADCRVFSCERDRDERTVRCAGTLNRRKF